MQENDKKKVLVLLVGPRRIASSRVRVLEYLDRLGRERNLVPDIKVGGSTLNREYARPVQLIVGAFVKRLRAVRMLLAVRNPGRYACVFVHRVLLPQMAVDRIRASGAKLIFDYDDALAIEGFLPPSIAKDRFEYIVQHADAVITSTEINKSDIATLSSRVHVIPSSVSLERIGASKDHDHGGPVTIGWIGSQSTEKYLESVVSPLLRLAQTCVFRFKTIGASRVLRIPGVQCINAKWSEHTEANEIGSLDIGIMPLTDDAWSRAKGGYKLLQYMAKGLPVVASPVGVNTDIIEHGISGYLPSSESDWLDALSKLIHSAQLRTSMGAAGRARVQREFSTEVAFRRLLSIFEELGV